MKHLPLDRPLACFDLETTGTDIGEDRIVQIAVIRVEPDGAEQSFVSLVNPGRSIPAAASAVHGIQDDDVREAPSFAALWPQFIARACFMNTTPGLATVQQTIACTPAPFSFVSCGVRSVSAGLKVS